MARLDTSQPPLMPRMIRLDPKDWTRLTKQAKRRKTTVAGLLREVLAAWLDEQENVE